MGQHSGSDGERSGDIFVYFLITGSDIAGSIILETTTIATPIKHPPTLIGLLHSTLKQIEREQEISPDEPAMRELKASILRAIAELELLRDSAA